MVTLKDKIDTNYQNILYKPVNPTTDKNLPTNLSVPWINSPALDQWVSIWASTNNADLINETVTRVFITPTQKAVVVQTSNTNSWDENLTTIVTKLVSTWATAPWSTPTNIWQIYCDTVAKKMYIAMWVASSADRIILN